MEIQTQERIIELVTSKDMRKFLQKYKEKIDIGTYAKIISTSPVSLEKKADLLSELLESADEVEKHPYISERYELIRAALDSLMHTDRKHSIIQMCHYSSEEWEPSLESAELMRTYADVQEDILLYDKCEGIASDFDPSCCDFYNELKQYDLTEDYEIKARFRYYCDPNGEPQYCDAMYESPDYVRPPKTPLSDGWDFSDSETPFAPGDILRINCRPYGPETFCMVYDVGKATPESISGIWCLYAAADGVIGIGRLGHGYFFLFETVNPGSPWGWAFSFGDLYEMSIIAPLYAAEIYTGELPESCAFMKSIQNLICNSPEGKRQVIDIVRQYGELSDDIFQYCSDIKPYPFVNTFGVPDANSFPMEIMILSEEGCGKLEELINKCD